MDCFPSLTTQLDVDPGLKALDEPSFGKIRHVFSRRPNAAVEEFAGTVGNSV